MNSSFIRIGELITSWAIIIAVGIYAALFFNAMATSSLWNDELYTIMHFSSQGIVTTVTDYHAPNNHIFFNLLNAVLPGENVYQPLRARLWSFVFMISAAVLAIGYFFRQGYFLEGSLFFAVFYLNQRILELCLEARGYGLLFFFATATTVLTIEYLKTNKTAYLWLLALLAVLGTWTIPVYVFFGGIILALLFLYQRDIKTFAAGCVAAFLIIILHLPVINEILRHARRYGARWGEDYAKMDAVAQTFHDYLFYGINMFFGWAAGVKNLGRLDWLIFLSISLVFWGVGILFYKEDKLGKALQLLTFGVIIFFSACLFMETPIVRTTAFIVPVFIIVSLFAFSRIYRYHKLSFLRPYLYTCAGVTLLLSSYLIVKNFSYTPKENWLAVAEFIENNFDDETLVFCDFRKHFLRVYLDEAYEMVNKFDAKKFKNGELVVVEGDFKKSKKDRLSAAKMGQLATEVIISQKRGGFQRIIFVPQTMTN